MSRVFLLSPASVGGARARVLLRDEARFPLARRVQSADGAAIGEVFAFLSGLYFRGKLTYARAFAAPPPGVGHGAYVITSNRGLLPLETPVDRDALVAFGDVDIAAGDPRYRVPLTRDARELALALAEERRCEVVLLGSIASTKYVDVLLEVFGERLVFPSDFIGRGDMSRGGLLLRAARAAEELAYAPVLGAKRHGGRPPKLTPHGGRAFWKAEDRDPDERDATRPAECPSSPPTPAPSPTRGSGPPSVPRA